MQLQHSPRAETALKITVYCQQGGKPPPRHVRDESEKLKRNNDGRWSLTVPAGAPSLDAGRSATGLVREKSIRASENVKSNFALAVPCSRRASRRGFPTSKAIRRARSLLLRLQAFPTQCEGCLPLLEAQLLPAGKRSPDLSTAAGTPSHRCFRHFHREIAGSACAPD